jgi:hypothetical protein
MTRAMLALRRAASVLYRLCHVLIDLLMRTSGSTSGGAPIKSAQPMQGYGVAKYRGLRLISSPLMSPARPGSSGSAELEDDEEPGGVR